MTFSHGRWLRLSRGLLAACALGAALPEASCAESPPPAALASSKEVLAHLNAVIHWYRQSQAGAQWVLQPSDVYFWNIQKTLTTDGVKAAFASARAEAALIPEPPPPKAASGAAPKINSRRIASQLAQIEEHLSKAQLRLADLDKQIAASGGPPDQKLVDRRNAAEAEASLYGAMRDSLQKLSTFLDGTDDGGSSTLEGQISALQRSVPEVFDAQTSSAKGGGEPTVQQSSGGLIARAGELFSLVRSRHAMDQLGDETAKLESEANRLAAPLRTSLRDAVTQGQNAAEQLDSADDGHLGALGAGLAGAARTFKAASAALLPLRQEATLFDSDANNLSQWRQSFDQQYDAIIRVLVARAGAVLLAIAVLGVVSELWRRATFKYVRDARRRRQLLLVRRIVSGSLMVMIIVMGFVSDFSSLATFAGFITAGVAVALQAIILSMAAYFFLIGRYGVRVGDRVTVGGVTGEVIDVGLVRVYMMELAGTGTVLHPTGRVAVFPNSALFQASPLYKQIPGTDYLWHQVSVTLSPEGDSAYAEEKLLGAVNAIYGEYKSRLEEQHQVAERLIDLRIGTPGPSAHVQFTDGGLELIVRYPIETQRAAEIDDAVTKQMLDSIRKDPKLRQAVSGTPRIRLAA